MRSLQLSIPLSGFVPAGNNTPPPPPTGQLSDATVINATVTNGFEPLGVIFSTDLSDAHQLSHHIKWTFDDIGSYDLLASGRLSGRDQNIAYGPIAAHSFPAGTFAVSCNIHDGTDFQTLTTTITVSSAGVHFPSTNAIAVSNDSTWTGAPAGATQVSSIAAAISALHENNGGHIILQRGQTFPLASGRQLIRGDLMNGTANKNEVSLGAFGTGAKPIIDTAANHGYLEFTNFQHKNSQISFSDIEVRGGYSAITGSGSRSDGLVIGTGATKGHFTVHGCKFYKGSQNISNISTVQGLTELNFLVTGTEISEWEDYGIWSQSGNIGLAGNSIKQHPQAVNGTEGKSLGATPNYPDHGPMRIVESFKAAISKNDLFSRNGWSSASKGWQPCIRTETDAQTAGAAFYAVTENQCEGSGVGLITNSSQNGVTLNQSAGAYVIDKNHLIGSTASYKMMDIGKGNTVIKNNILVAPNVAALPSWNDMSNFVDMAPDGGHGAGNLTEKILIQNNSFVDLRSSANQAADSTITVSADVSSEGWADFAQQSNIYHAPNRTSPTVTSNLDASDVFTPECDGHRFDTSVPTEPTPAGVGSTASYKPGAGSDAIGAATLGQHAVDDFDGNIRSTVLSGLTRTTPSRGAFEPNLEN